MWAGVAQSGLISTVLFSLCVNNIHTTSHHAELVQYMDITALIVMSHSPSLLVGVLGLLLNRRSGLSVINSVLLYKHLIKPMMDCVCV
jgi:hypothetical protein